MKRSPILTMISPTGHINTDGLVANRKEIHENIAERIQDGEKKIAQGVHHAMEIQIIR